MTIMYDLFLDRCRRSARDPGACTIDDHEVASPEPESPEPWESITSTRVHAAWPTSSTFREVYEAASARKLQL